MRASVFAATTGVLVPLLLAVACSDFGGGGAPDALDAASDGIAPVDAAPVPEPDATADADAGASCAYDCRGGACVDGICGPVTIVAGLDRPYALAVDADAVYFTDLGPSGSDTNGKLVACAGPPPCTPTLLAGTLESPRAVAITADAVFVSQWWPARTSPANAIYGFKRIDGMPLPSFPFGAYGARGLAATTDTAWFADLGSSTAGANGDGNVSRMTKQAGTYLFDAYVIQSRRPELVAVLPGGTVREFFTADNALYEAGNANSVASGQQFVDLTSDGSTLFWIDTMPTTPKIFTCGTGCANAFVAELAPAPTASGLAADATGVYWVEEGATPKSGRVRRLPKGSTTPVTLLDGLARPQKIALTTTDMFITVLGDGPAPSGALLRLAKP
jgi:hypothetical protein